MNLCLKQHLMVKIDKALILRVNKCHLRELEVEAKTLEDLRVVLHTETGVVQDQTQEEVEVAVD